MSSGLECNRTDARYHVMCYRALITLSMYTSGILLMWKSTRGREFRRGYLNLNPPYSPPVPPAAGAVFSAGFYAGFFGASYRGFYASFCGEYFGEYARNLACGVLRSKRCAIRGNTGWCFTGVSVHFPNGTPFALRVRTHAFPLVRINADDPTADDPTADDHTTSARATPTTRPPTSEISQNSQAGGLTRRYRCATLLRALTRVPCQPNTLARTVRPFARIACLLAHTCERRRTPSVSIPSNCYARPLGQ